MNAQTPPSRNLDKVIVRLPDGMREWIAEEAKKNLRSANAQVVWMLQQIKDEAEKRSS